MSRGVPDSGYSQQVFQQGGCLCACWDFVRSPSLSFWVPPWYSYVKPGDIIIVPAGVVHGWLDIPDHVDYLSFRPSPGILTAGFTHPVLRK